MSRPWTQNEILVGLGVLLLLVWIYLNRETVSKWLNSSSTPVSTTGNSSDSRTDPTGLPSIPSPQSPSPKPVPIYIPDPLPSPQLPSPAPVPIYIPDPMPVSSQPSSSYSYLGCYTDTIPRDLPIDAGVMSLDECANEARSNNFKVFGVQYSEGSGYIGLGGQCWYGKDTGYGIYGPASNCTPYNDMMLGQFNSNALYTW